MNLVRCDNGHFFDAERFESCPHCNAEISIDKPENHFMGHMVNMGIMAEVDDFISEDPIDSTHSNQTTIGYFGAVPAEPVVGWLVAIEGSNFGEDFKLKSGRNFIGRSTSMDIALTGDSSISREKHAIILYEPRGNVFLVQPGDAKELFYLNDKVVLTATEINAYDVLSLGGTKLLFVPCCSDKFNWDSVKTAEEQK